jgi:hypothetical protein
LRTIDSAMAPIAPVIRMVLPARSIVSMFYFFLSS